MGDFFFYLELWSKGGFQVLPVKGGVLCTVFINILIFFPMR